MKVYIDPKIERRNNMNPMARPVLPNSLVRIKKA